MEVIKLENITKVYTVKDEKQHSVFEKLFKINKDSSKKFVALDNISFSVNEGEMIGIIGHNGSGKTTLLRILAGITNPSSGDIQISGKVVPFLQIGSSFQGELNAIENIKLAGAILGLNRKEIRSKIWDILGYAELENFATTQVKHFSAGMFARLAFAIAIQTNPDILLLDEVLAVGDLSFQRKSYQTFISLREKRKTVLYVTHNLSEVEKLCDKVILLEKGKLIGFGKPQEIIKKYRDMMKESITKIDSKMVDKISIFFKELLDREPDDVGLYSFIQKIKAGEIALNDIPQVIKMSDEYIKKHKT